MQYKNPIDKELVFAAEEAYNALASLFEVFDISVDKMYIAVSLRDAIANARLEMQMQEDAEKEDFLTTTSPPTSND